jgi:hypothetical protein
MKEIVYCYELIVPYPVPVYVFRKEPNLTVDELAITYEEFREAVLCEEEYVSGLEFFPELLEGAEIYHITKEEIY